VRRRELLNEAIAHGGELPDLIRALVLPLSEKLDDRNGGPCYLQFIAQLLRDPNLLKGKLDQRKNPTAEELMRRTSAKLAHLPGPVRDARIQLEVSLLFHSLANFSRKQGKATKPTAREKELFENNLIDAIVAVLTAPISPETKRALRPRRATGARSGRSRAKP